MHCRYIRLTGVYAIIIGLHATLLKYFATGPQSHMVSSMVTKCTNGQSMAPPTILATVLMLFLPTGWWLNLLYINNFDHYIYEKSPAGSTHDCVNVSW